MCRVCSFEAVLYAKYPDNGFFLVLVLNANLMNSPHSHGPSNHTMQVKSSQRRSQPMSPSCSDTDLKASFTYFPHAVSSKQPAQNSYNPKELWNLIKSQTHPLLLSQIASEEIQSVVSLALQLVLPHLHQAPPPLWDYQVKIIQNLTLRYVFYIDYLFYSLKPSPRVLIHYAARLLIHGELPAGDLRLLHPVVHLAMRSCILNIHPTQL